MADMTITLITGANKGLGRETARRLIEKGHTVYIGARDTGRGRAAAEELHARSLQLDVTDEESVAAAAARLEAEHGRLDVLVNNAGITGARKPPGETPPPTCSPSTTPTSSASSG
jgi:NAD(P)-dependent dehydrogenase (short-subunit alcohol dehydrogenase family)